MALLEYLKLFGEDVYIKERLFKLVSKFKSEWVYQKNKILWHYWPLIYYKGWNEKDNISLHTPKKAPSKDYLYEDVSHAALNVLAIVEFYKNFPNKVISKMDLTYIINTIKYNLIKGNYTFSKFLSGNDIYAKPSIFYFPHFGWINLAKDTLKNFLYSLFPMLGPNFDEQRLFYDYSVLAERTDNISEKFCYYILNFDNNTLKLDRKTRICIQQKDIHNIFFNFSNIQIE